MRKVITTETKTQIKPKTKLMSLIAEQANHIIREGHQQIRKAKIQIFH